MDLEYQDNAPNMYVTISSFDQIQTHTVELAKLLSAYYVNLDIPDKELKRAMMLNYQAYMIQLGVLGVGQQLIEDDNEEDMK